jgi:hypothetical protein
MARSQPPKTGIYGRIGWTRCHENGPNAVALAAAFAHAATRDSRSRFALRQPRRESVSGAEARCEDVSFRWPGRSATCRGVRAFSRAWGSRTAPFERLRAAVAATRVERAPVSPPAQRSRSSDIPAAPLGFGVFGCQARSAEEASRAASRWSSPSVRVRKTARSDASQLSVTMSQQAVE